MRRGRYRPHVQLDLFRPRSALPVWRTLPSEVKQQVHALVVQLLKEHRLGRRGQPGGKVAADE